MVESHGFNAAHTRLPLISQTFRLVLAGVSAIAVLAVASGPALASGTLADNIAQTITFTDQNGGTTMGIAFDGTNYWSVSGGGSGGLRLAQYDASGAPVTRFTPGLDFRSIFTNASNQVFARAYNSRVIYVMSAPGVFTPSVTLTGGSIDAQSSVVLNTAGDRYIAQIGGTVSTWDLTGAFVGNTTMVGFGTIAGENNYPSRRGIAAFAGQWLTYNSSNRTVSAWDPATGNRVGQGVLTGAGTSFNSAFGFSFTRAAAYVVDTAGAAWRGFTLLPTSTAVSCSPSTLAAGNPSTCTATITDTSAGTLSAPSGSVTFTESGGTFTGSPCTLVAVNTSSSSCQVTYTGATVGARVVTATYSGGSHAPSSGTTTVTVTARTTGASLACNRAAVGAGGTTTCTVTVADTDSGNKSVPTGTVSFTAAAGGTFTPAQCTLAPVGATTTSSCSASYTTTSSPGGTTITAGYSGDVLHAAASGSFTFTPTLPAAGHPAGSPGPQPSSPWSLLALLAGAGLVGALVLGRRA